jgi:Kdo2-lipid IVA lauroyltransferase/acyltransferase
MMGPLGSTESCGDILNVTETLPRRTKLIELWITRQTARSLLWGLRWLPDRALLGFGAMLGSLFYATLHQYRRVARANLQRAFGDTWSEETIERMVRRSFRHCGQTLAEFMTMSSWSSAEVEKRVELRGRHHLDAALAQGRGALLVTAHYGNWELMAARLVRAGYALHVIARDADDPATNALINWIRGKCGYDVISRRDATRPALECLRRNECLGILLDQNTVSGEVYVDFFGHPAATAPGPAILARRTGAPLVPIFDRRREDGTHVVEFQPPLEWTATGDREADVLTITAQLTQTIERQIRAEPAQWFWIHNRWKRQKGRARCSVLGARSDKGAG